MGVPAITPSANSVPKHSYEAAVDETKTQIFVGRGNIYRFVCDNNDSSDVFLQFYDAAATGDVTVGTDIIMEYRVSATGTLGIDAADSPLRFFSKGCVIAVVSSRGGVGAPGIDASVNSWFVNMVTFG